MKKQKKSIILLIVFLIINILFSFALVSNAEEDAEKGDSKYSEKYLELTGKQKSKFSEKYKTNLEKTKDENAEDTSNYSEDYKRYLELSDEEKAKVEVIPRKYNIPLDSLYEDTIEVKDLNLGSGKDTKRVSIYQDSLPSKFDLRDKINVQVENQKTYGLCWDFASVKSLETNLALKKGINIDFSELHVDYLTSNLFGGWRELHEGGHFSTFEGYFIEENGPVYESEVPYDAIYNESQFEYLKNLEPKAYIYEDIDFPTIDRTNNFNTYTDEELELFKSKVKKHLTENGSLYCVIATPDWGTAYFNSVTKAEYFTGDWSQCNDGREIHAVSIIGWDDNYSRYNFNENQRPEKDGAYILLNSWGNNWGDNGVFYVSYEDYYVSSQVSGIVSAGIDLPVYEEIKFEDRNLYNAIKDILGNKIHSFNDSQMSIKISKIVLEKTTYMYFNEGNIKNITGLDKFYNLSSLGLDGNDLENIDALNNLVNLKHLTLCNCNITKIPNFSNLMKLENLYLGGNNIENLEELSKLTNLKDLSLYGCNITEFPNFPNLKSLDYLELSENPIKKGKFYAETIDLINCDIDNNTLNNLDFENTRKVDLENNNITNTESFNKYQLEYLNLSFNPIENISGLNNISNLDISYTDVKNISGLENLIFLNISGNENVNGIDNLTKLQEIWMNNCNISDLTPLSNLQNLEGISVENNKISDLTPLSNLQKLESIYVNSNNISDLTPLSNLQNLEGISVENNKISDLTPLSNLQNLSNVELNNNNISDLSPLANLQNINYISAGNNKISFIPDGLVGKNVWLIEQIVSFNVNQNIYINTKTGIKLNDIFSYDYADPYNIGLEFILSNCDVDYNKKELYITPTSLGNGQAVLKVNGGIYSGSEFTINYNAIKEPTSIADYLFDSQYYADNNPDVKEIIGTDPLKLKKHYFEYGIAEGRLASHVFDVKYYLDKYPDVYNAYKNDYYSVFYHFVNYGIYEGRRSSKEFDVKYYIERYKDVANAFNNDYADSLIHYACHGRFEGRAGSEDAANEKHLDYMKSVFFDEDLYLNMYPDIQQAIGNNSVALYNHFKNFGIKEGRIASYVFDPKYYIESNPDIKEVFGNDYYKVFYHFLNNGIDEGRVSSKLFNINYYLDNNKDVKNVYENIYRYENYMAIRHFILYGINEGRIGSEEFSVHVYKDKNNDLSAAYGNNWKNYYRHYILWGQKENRICN